MQTIEDRIVPLRLTERSSKIVENAQFTPSLRHAERINRNLLASIKS
jgi:hypothetical protein